MTFLLVTDSKPTPTMDVMPTDLLTKSILPKSELLASP